MKIKERNMNRNMKWAAIVISGLFMSIASFACSDSTVEAVCKPLPDDAPIIIAHRGASGDLPEHTLEAYQLAIDQCADFIEPDLVMTKDGVLIARHDRYLSTTTNIAEIAAFADRKRASPYRGNMRHDWWVEDFTLAEIKELKARQPFEGRTKEFDDLYDIPTFAEILALVEQTALEGRTVGIYPETKAPSHHQSVGLDMVEPLLSDLGGSKIDAMSIPVFIQSFEQDILKTLGDRSDYPLVQLLTGNINAIAAGYEPIRLQIVVADGIGPSKAKVWRADTAIPNSTVKVAHENDLTVHPWTLRADQVDPRFGSFEAEINALVDQGVDGLFTDHPAIVRDILEGRYAKN